MDQRFQLHNTFTLTFDPQIHPSIHRSYAESSLLKKLRGRHRCITPSSFPCAFLLEAIYRISSSRLSAAFSFLSNCKFEESTIRVKKFHNLTGARNTTWQPTTTNLRILGLHSLDFFNQASNAEFSELILAWT